MRAIGLPYSETGPASTKYDSRHHNITCRLTVALLAAVVLTLVIAPVVYALPKRIIILRHGEKMSSYELCPVGEKRSLALRDNYLGKGAANSLFSPGEQPAAFFATTLHCLELANPAAQSWGMPIQLYSVVPKIPGQTTDETVQLNERTQEAAKSILTDARWNGKTIVVVWEHDHIADQSLEQQFYYEEVTLRQLLNLNTLPNVPPDWLGGNYDYFWIIDYGNPPGSVSSRPTRFTLKKQVFLPPYDKLPSTDWGTPEDLTGTGCE